MARTPLVICNVLLTEDALAPVPMSEIPVPIPCPGPCLFVPTRPVSTLPHLRNPAKQSVPYELLTGRCGAIVYHDGKAETKVARLDELKLIGRHNHENVMAAVAITTGMGVPMEIGRAHV